MYLWGDFQKCQMLGGVTASWARRGKCWGGVTIFVGSATRTRAHPSATEGPHNDPCTPDFEDFARWDGVWARMAAYFGDAVLIALWLR